MGLTLRHRAVLCSTFHPWTGTRTWGTGINKAWLAAQLCPSVDPVGHMESVTHTRAVLMLFPFPRPSSSTWRTSDCEHRTDLGTWHSKGSQW